MPVNTLAHIIAGDTTFVFPVNPYTATWGYKQNSVSTDTLGGRVVQLLSVYVDQLMITSVAGSRSELQRVADSAKDIMDFHVSTLRPARLVVPSRKWDFKVYLTALPQIGWDIAATTYPYTMTFLIDEDISGVKTHQVEEAALARLYNGIGYDPSVHGGDPKAFDKTVKTVVSAAALGAGATTAGKGGPSGTVGQWQGKGLWPSDIANAPWQGNSLQQEIYNAWVSVFDASVANHMTCIADRESSFQPDVWNSYGSPIHYVYGLYQISDVHSASSWWPKTGVHRTEGGLMYDPEYNVRCAMSLYRAALGGLDPWASTTGKCA